MKRGYAIPMRVLAVRTPAKLHQARIGKRVKQYVYELYMTSQPVGSLSALDIISFATRFPQPGRYKLWGQFNHDGEIIMADFWVEVVP